MQEREAASLAAENNLYIGDWLVEPSTGLVTNASRSHRLEPKVMQVLLCLAANPDRTVSRDRLMEEAWGGAIVSEDAVNRCISRLRKVFADETVKLDTVPKIGYRLRGVVRPAVETQVQHTPEDGVTAVAPSANVSAGSDWPGRTTVGTPLTRVLLMAAGLLLVLSIIGGLAVTSRRSPAGLPAFRVLPLTSLPGHEVMPSFSPDGNHVAFAWKGAKQDNWDIYIKPVGREETLRLTSDPLVDMSPAWSPRGNEVAFVRYAEDSAHLMLVSSIGGAERRVASYRADNGSELSWMPDGAALAFSGQTDEASPSRIFVVRTSDGAVEPITNPAASLIGDEYPRFSPDGSILAFVRTRALGVSDLHLLDRSGKEARRLTFDNLKIHGLAWEADGQSLLFSSNRGGSFGLWRLSLNESEPQPLAFSGRNVDSVAVSRDGRRTAYQEWLGRASLARLDLASQDPVSTISQLGSTRFEWDPEFSPDGARLAFVSDRSGSAEVWVSESDGSNPLQITRFGGPYTKTVRWSPDGRRLVLTAPTEGHFDVFVAEADGSVLRRLTFEASDDFAPAWSPDGQTIYFASNRSGKWNIWAMRADGTRQRQITREGGKAALPSSDGRWLYYSKEDQPGIWRHQPGSQADDRQIVTDLQPVDWNNWEVSADRIYYVARPAPDRPVLIEFDPVSGQGRRLTALPDLHYDSGISLHAKQLILSSVVQSESDLVLVERSSRP